jgi:predicted metal-dependent phosphoesterase TrpH
MKPEDLLKKAYAKGLDGIAVTDHHTISGALKVAKLNKRKDFEVIIGAEIRTEYGELQMHYLNEPIKSRKMFEVIDEAKSQGALIVVPHMFRIFPHIKFWYPIEKIKNKIDALECLNGRSFCFENKLVQRKCKELGMACTAGSDCHYPFEVANAWTVFDGDLKKALKLKKTKLEGSGCHVLGSFLSPFSRIKHLVSEYH